MRLPVSNICVALAAIGRSKAVHRHGMFETIGCDWAYVHISCDEVRTRDCKGNTIEKECDQ